MPQANPRRVRDARIEGQLVATPQHDDDAAGLEEHRLLQLLTAPAEPLVERSGAVYIVDSQSDEADALFHRPNVPSARDPYSTPLR